MSDDAPVRVQLAAIDPRWWLNELYIDEMRLISLRWEHPTFGHLDLIMSRRSASALRDILIRVLMEPAAPALPIPAPPQPSY